jgi:hypothetical protein
MNDRHYRWQDHVPPTVGMTANMIFAAVFLVAVVLIGGHLHERREAALMQGITQSIDHAAATHADSIGAGDDAPLSVAGAPLNGETRLLLACVSAPQES